MANLGNRDAMLREVLGHKVKRSSFVDFCNREHCAENLLFYNAICEFEGAGDEAARVAKVRSFRRQRRAANPVRCSPRAPVSCAQARDIVATYVNSGATNEVNMTDESREMLCTRVAAGEVPADLFTTFKAAAFKDMRGDTLPRYLKSDLYAAVCDATAGGGGELVMASCQYADIVSVRLPLRRWGTHALTRPTVCRAPTTPASA